MDISGLICPKEGGMTVVTNDKNKLIPTRTVTGWRVYMDYRKLNKVARKDHFPLLFLDEMLDRLADYKVLARYDKMNLVLNWEKCHFMVEEGIVLGHKISKKGIEVDKAKIEVVSKLPPLTSMKGVQSFLSHAGFYRRFIKDFSKVVNPLCKLLEKDAKFNSNDDCMRAFELLKFKLTTTPMRAMHQQDLSSDPLC
ncbi:uncharacterized mitochondrial protein AtMg00860-like [Nicotiana tomentosiformis]|uniref:uncharacterized mitochondrial protein AtMg00860-like n=1 Tax=Nicotiana tomentosiformis TaxID=4098 RepID=UPI00388C7B84